MTDRPSKLNEQQMTYLARVPNAYKRSNTGRDATDLVLSYVLEGLVEGVFVPGQRLNAKQITEDLGVSIVPVREALHYLAGEGLVELLPRKGARIPEMNSEETVRWWDIYAAVGKPAFVRSAAIFEKDPALVDQLDEIMLGIHALVNTDNHRRFIMTLLGFHRVLNDITGSWETDEANRRLQVVYWCSFLPQFVDFDKYGKEFAEHYQLIADLLKLGAAEAAYATFEWHVAWSSALIEGKDLPTNQPWAKR